jgi:nucleotide-binding universal stress UspA family protein
VPSTAVPATPVRAAGELASCPKRWRPLTARAASSTPKRHPHQRGDGEHQARGSLPAIERQADRVDAGAHHHGTGGRRDRGQDALDGPARAWRRHQRTAWPTPSTSGASGGDAAKQISETATDLPADLIVLATRGRTAIEGLVLGSVIQRLLQIAPCPVFVVPTAVPGDQHGPRVGAGKRPQQGLR